MVRRSRVYGSSSGACTVVAAARSAAALYLTCVVILSFGGGAGGGATAASAAAVGTSLADFWPADANALAEPTAAAATAAGTAPGGGRSGGKRSANLSHIMGTSRKVKMFIKHRYLQVLPDGTVNSTSEDASDFVILQRTSVTVGQLKIQGVATCMYLCMDACGLLYGSKDFEEECVFNEMLERHNYNTYTSVKYSNERRALYLALNKHGSPRKVQVNANAPLGKLSTCTRVLTQAVSQDRIDQLMASWHGHRHHHGCPPHTGPPLPSKHRKSGGNRKCQGKGDGRKKSRDETGSASSGSASGSREDEECAGNKKNGRCGGGGGGDEISHRKADAAGRKKKSKKSGKGAADKPRRLAPGGKVKKPEPDFLPEPLIVIQAVTTVAAPPSRHVVHDEVVDDDDDDDDIVGNDEDAAGMSAATAATDEFLESNNN